MLKRSSLSLVLVAATLAVAGGAEPAGAAEPQVLGQVAPVNDVNGHCSCTRFQRKTAAATSGYAFPYSGVLTKFRVRIGETTQAGDWVQARTFRTPGPTTARVISEGAEHSIVGLAAGPTAFIDRVPATAGDLLGARFNVGGSAEETPALFPTASAEDALSYGTVQENPLAGSSFATADATSRRVNIEAVLEHDEDGDGYGDNSQDLCPGSPIATSACSGRLFGSDLQGERSTPLPFCGAGGCMRVQATIGGVSTAAPFDGVVVRWRVLDAHSGPYRVRVVAPKPDPGPGIKQYTVLRSSAAETVTAPTQPVVSQIASFPTRLPIPAGGYVGLDTNEEGFQTSGGAATYVETNEVPDGTTATGVSHNGTILYDADIEPDADHDGYGDVTQDECPTDASTQGACPSSPPLATTPTGASTQGTRSPTSRPSTKTPAISHFEVVPAKFRIEKGGAVISRRRTHAGTTLKLTLSEAATVTFTMERSIPCKHARKKGKGCTRWVFVHAFKRNLHRGSSSLPYSGRYRRGGRPHSLKPGFYRMNAVPTSAAGKTGAAASARLTVLP